MTISNRRHWIWILGVLGIGSLPLWVGADTGGALNSGDTTFIFIATALVMLMTPGLGLFYGGMVRQKNVLATIMQSFVALGVVSLQWAFCGYSLAFGTDVHGWIGGLNFLGLQGVGLVPNPAYAPTIPHQAFMLFQMMFAVITPALISGAFAERFKFSAYLVFLLLWSTLIYDPIAHWVWGNGGWLKNLGVLDFAGGIVVHISAGISALVVVLMLGKRKNYPKGTILPHNLTMVVMGTALLWFGWFGFNAGSALAANGTAFSAFTATNLAGAAAMMAWLLLEWWVRGKPTALGAVSGAVAGLAAVTPASGFISPFTAVLIGLAASPICYGAIQLKNRLGYDDSLDVFGVHGIAGILGVLATGLFASLAINPAGANGWFYGNLKLFQVQALAAGVVVLFAAIGTFVIVKVIDLVIGIRVADHEEVIGLDLTQHGEAGYHNVG